MRRKHGEGTIEKRTNLDGSLSFRARASSGRIRLSGRWRAAREEAERDRIALSTEAGRLELAAEMDRELQERVEVQRQITRSYRRKSLRVYFVQSEETGAIKIGQTTNIASRVATLQTANAGKLRLLATCFGGDGEEQRLHRAYRHLRTNGEWFQPAPELLAYIAEIAIAHRQTKQPDGLKGLVNRLRALADQIEASLPVVRDE